ncbi:ABC transporter permease [Coprococcus comes]|uniref:ABC transporter permease n=1 Tax=Coprococcus comes TaxID=410072 RepID=A0A412QD29_9FIRM|nr:ABC transporter permease [Coprococcus comes]RGT88823.1 ABC transporter permease [Coprococcus comes]
MFHKNIPNNNKDIIRFLAKNFAGTKKIRNTILFCSVVIGIVAITMVFGISFGKIQAEEIRLTRENGTASSGRIEDGTEEQYAKLKQLDYIKQVGKSIFVGEATDISEDNAKTICNVVWADSESWNNFLKPAYTNVIGSYPQKKDEILLSERALKKLGISEPDQGMEINLDVYKGVFEHSKETFKLCGWYTDFGNELATGYISHDKINELNLEKGSYTLLFSQSNHLSRSKIEEKLYQTLPMKSAEQKIYVSDTAQYTAVSKLSGGYELVILGTLGILCGIYFLVRNVLWISMSEDIQNLGLLHTIGATERQITKIYRKQMRSLMLKGSVLGSLLSVVILVLMIPEILGVHFYQEMGGNTILSFFRPWILLLSVVFVNGILWMASEEIIRKITKLSCIESATYDGNMGDKKEKHPGKLVLKRSEAGEMFYIAWENITRYKVRFIIASLSIFLGVLSFILMNVLTNGCDYKYLLEKRPDFLLAGEFSEFGKSQGCGEEYKTREIDVDPLLTQGDGVELLYDNDYDEFAPISQELEKKLHKIDGIDWENSNLIEGAYVTTVISKKGIRPYDEGLSNLTDDNMVEGFSWDTVQVIDENQILSLKKYVQDNQLNIDMESLEEGNGVLIIHDHMLTPEQQKLADEAIGEPVYFKTLISREDAIRRKELSNFKSEEEQEKDEFPQKESETFTLCGYLDRQSDNFPEIHQSWHGEGSLYYFISEKGFQKIPTEKKILTMELTADPEKEPYVKAQIGELISEENKKRSEMTEVSMDEGTGEAGVFVICKSDLMQQKETYMRGNRILLGAVSIILFIAGLTNYCNVVFTGMYARRKEFDIMKSIGMTDKQMKLMFFGEGGYYFMCVMGMLLTAGMATLVGVKIYMENKLSYFTFHWPIHVTVGVTFSLVLINVMVTHFIYKKR